MKHTKGKWNLFLDEENGFGITNGNTVIAIAGETDLKENEANANLIASAPDTYKVAKEVVDYVESNGIDKWSDEEKEDSFVWGLYKYYAEEAVAKAEGKQ